jgi:two-component system chemotaxis response regulator CheB
MHGDELHVLVVDDSAMVRQVMQAILTTNSRVKVNVAADPLIAWSKMQKEPPDVVITDLEMPRMDGLTFIRKIMLEMPTPVVVCSGLAARGTELALRALEEGAVEVITKPKVGVRDFLHESAVTLVDAVWGASQAHVRPRQTPFCRASRGRRSRAQRVGSLPPALRQVEPKPCVFSSQPCRPIARQSSLCSICPKDLPGRSPIA